MEKHFEKIAVRNFRVFIAPPTMLGCGVDADTAEDKKRRRSSAPRFLSVPHSHVVREGEEVRLCCSVSGWPQPYTVWKRAQEPVSPAFNVFEEDDLRRLIIPAVRKEHAGVYTVVCSNTRGTIQASANIQVISKGNALFFWLWQIVFRIIVISKKLTDWKRWHLNNMFYKVWYSNSNHIANCLCVCS